MEWLTNSVNAMERSSRTVASNANKVVQRMQKIMNEQEKRIQELEGSIGIYHTLCLDSLQAEINRLEIRKKDLLLELETTEETLNNRRRTMEHSKIKLQELMDKSNINAANNSQSSSSAASSSNLLSYTLNSIAQMPKLLSKNNYNEGNSTSLDSRGKDMNSINTYDGDDNGYGYGSNERSSTSHAHPQTQTPILTQAPTKDGDRYGNTSSFSTSGNHYKNNTISSITAGSNADNYSHFYNNYINSNDDDIFTPSIMDPEQVDDQDIEFIEEVELLSSIRDIVVPQQLLFVLQRSDSDSIIAYLSSQYEYANDVVQAVKLSNRNLSGNGVPPMQLSTLEQRLGLSARLVPNHEREFPDVISMGVPVFARQDLYKYTCDVRDNRKRRGSNSSNDNNDNNTQSSGHGENGDSTEGGATRRDSVRFDAQLLGAVEIPVVTEIVIDVWETNHWQWATTTINGVKFAVLERIFITCDVSADEDDDSKEIQTGNRSSASPGSSGLKVTVLEIHLFGRHPQQGHILNERIMVTSGY